MNEPELFDALREGGVDADRPEIRAAIRLLVEHIDSLRTDEDPHAARRCMEAMDAALHYLLTHPEVDDMSSFESNFEDGDPE